MLEKYHDVHSRAFLIGYFDRKVLLRHLEHLTRSPDRYRRLKIDMSGLDRRDPQYTKDTNEKKHYESN